MAVLNKILDVTICKIMEFYMYKLVRLLRITLKHPLSGLI